MKTGIHLQAIITYVTNHVLFSERHLPFIVLHQQQSNCYHEFFKNYYFEKNHNANYTLRRIAKLYVFSKIITELHTVVPHK